MSYRKAAVAGMVATLVMVFGLCVAARGALTPGQKMAVEALIKQFSAPEFEARQKAVDQIVELGPDVVPVIKDAMAKTLDAEVKLRCEMVLKALRTKFGAEAIDGPKASGPETPAAGADFPSSKITINATNEPLEDVLQKFADQSKNALVHMPEKWDGEPVTFECKGMPYWQALDKLCASLGNYYYSFDYGRTTGMANGMALWKATKRGEIGAYAGPVSVKLTNGSAVRSLRGPQANPYMGIVGTTPPPSGHVLTYSLAYYWEDRLPVLAKDVTVTRALAPGGKEIKVLESDTRYWGEFAREQGVRPYFANFNATLLDVPEGLDRIAELDGVVTLTYGTGEKTMEIKDVLNAVGKSVVDGDTTLTVVKVDKREAMVAVIVKLQKGDKTIEVPVYPYGAEYGFLLVGADGARIKAGYGNWGGNVPAPAPGAVAIKVGQVGGAFGTAPTAQAGPGEHGVQFYGKVEGAWTLVYSKPREVWSKDYPFVIKDAPLP